MTRETIIKNKWTGWKCGEGEKVCFVLWHYEVGKRPYITIEGYNPFPFYSHNTEDGRLYTSRSVLNKWMLDNGWKPEILRTTIISKIDICK